jgi:hypothetical protein
MSPVLIGRKSASAFLRRKLSFQGSAFLGNGAIPYNSQRSENGTPRTVRPCREPAQPERRNGSRPGDLDPSTELIRPYPARENGSRQPDCSIRTLVTACVPATCDSQSQPDERHQSKILFIIVAVFLLCSLPRAILNLVEFEHMFSLYYLAYFVSPEEGEIVLKARAIQVDEDIACFYPPFWFVLFTNVSSLFMTINASLGFLIYSLGCSLFRAELSEKLRRLRNSLRANRAKLFNILYCRNEGIHV